MAVCLCEIRHHFFTHSVYCLSFNMHYMDGPNLALKNLKINHTWSLSARNLETFLSWHLVCFFLRFLLLFILFTHFLPPTLRSQGSPYKMLKNKQEPVKQWW